MNYEEAVKTIDSLLVFGSKPGLERVGELVERIGSPDKKLKFVHVAGTNGKGSVCAYISSVLCEAGYKTGLFISPYVLEFRERFQINGEMIPGQELADIVSEIYPVVLEMKDEGKIITEFEFVFAVALKWYEKCECDVVVLETGLGGRFDATNIIDTPLAAVIMSISLDHTAILGDTCEKIAFEKCGIIKQDGVTVLYGDQPEGVYEVVKKTARERNNRLVIADTASVRKISSDLMGTRFSFCAKELCADDQKLPEEKEYFTPLLGEHQIKNAAAAVYTLLVLRERGLSVSDEAIRSGLLKVSFPARSELLCKKPVVILDGAHNPGGAAALSKEIKELLAPYRKVGIVGMLADKDIRSALSELLPMFDSIITVTPNNPRAMNAEELAGIVRGFGVPVKAEDDYKTAFEEALDAAGSEGSAIIVFGSLYLASDMRRVILEALK